MDDKKAIIYKYNVKEKRYEVYNIPDNWYCTTYCDNMKQIVNCSQCGKEIKYGDSYTSLEIHDKVGFGYDVCEECYQKEFERKYGRKPMLRE